MTLDPSGKLLTTREAADSLQVPQPHLVRLLEHGEIPYRTVGTDRLVSVTDVLEFRRRRADVRRAKLRELSQLSAEEGGGYR